MQNFPKGQSQSPAPAPTPASDLLQLFASNTERELTDNRSILIFAVTKFAECLSGLFNSSQINFTNISFFYENLWNIRVLFGENYEIDISNRQDETVRQDKNVIPFLKKVISSSSDLGFTSLFSKCCHPEI